MLFSIAIASSCRKSTNSEPASSSPTVYIVGYEHNDSVGRTSIAKIWKNGIATNLSDGKGFAQAASIFVSGNDIYVAGSEIKDGVNVAKLWKNGVETALTDGSRDAAARSVFVTATDVYVVGIEDDGVQFVPKIWKNGVSTKLTHGSGQIDVHSIFVREDDIYVAGAEYNGDPRTNGAKLWKNGVDTIYAKVGHITGVMPLGNEIVVSGYYLPGQGSMTAAVWKNGILMNTQPSLYSASYANSLHVINNNIYIAGLGVNHSGQSLAVIWKNGAPANLSDGTNYANATSIYADSSGYYVVGHEHINGKNIAKLWANGVNTNLTDGKRHAVAMAVFVK